MVSEVERIKEKVYKKRRRRRKFRALLFLIFASIILMLAFALYSPVFNIREIEVQGQSKFTREQIINLSNIQIGQNIFKINSGQAVRSIQMQAYIESVRIHRKLPNQIVIMVVERKPIGIVNYLGSYILIDKKGYVLETVKKPEDKSLIEIKGIDIKKFTLGKLLKEEGSENLNAALNILTLIPKNDLLLKIDYIDVSNLDKVIMRIGDRFDAILGSASQLNSSGLYRRFLFLKQIIGNELNGQKGYIDMTDQDRPRYVPYKDPEPVIPDAGKSELPGINHSDN